MEPEMETERVIAMPEPKMETERETAVSEAEMEMKARIRRTRDGHAGVRGFQA
jgi:hypothetical protein